jgi:hypothetical protein
MTEEDHRVTNRRESALEARRASLARLRALPFRSAFRAATTHAPVSWNTVTTGLAAIATMLLVHTWLLLSQDNPPSLLGVVLLPLGAALVVRGWVYWRLVVMLLGIVVAFVGAAGPFWIMNAT